MRRGVLGVMRGAVVFAFALALWQAVVWLTGAPHFILPAPGRVAQRLWDARELVAQNALVTFAHILLGLLLGSALGVSTALQLAMSPLSRMVMRPILVFAQAVPIFALAPVITLWLGYGAASKIVTVVLIIYFPVTSAFFDGLMRTPQGHLDLARVMGGGPLRVLFRLRVPSAMPSLASGLRLAAVYAPFGAVIGEWVGASQGLGHLMLLANGRAQTDLMFACLFVLAAFTVALYYAVDRLGVGLAQRFTEPGG
ncbi:MAG: transporter permease [Hyphomicrobiales bacterium]|nr:transporter permease [Hyphomicrobiales bacterium]